MAMDGKVKNLGPIAGIVYRATEPNNKRVLWYDITVEEGCPIKYYNLTTNSWKKLAGDD